MFFCDVRAQRPRIRERIVRLLGGLAALPLAEGAVLPGVARLARLLGLGPLAQLLHLLLAQLLRLL